VIVDEQEVDLTSEVELIHRAQSGDLDAFCSLAERYTRRLYVLAFNFCRNAQDAEDLSQEVWLKAYKALGDFRYNSSFYTWLRRITTNTFLNHQRSISFSRKGHTTIAQLLTIDSQEVERLSASQVAAEETIYHRVLFEDVMEALAELTPRERLMFLLRHYEGMSYEEIATAMNCASGTVKKSVWRALGKLRAKLDARNDSSDNRDHVVRLATEY
jgi:RNA polymerase sigma-70 factor (ECF subfamily)